MLIRLVNNSFWYMFNVHNLCKIQKFWGNLYYNTKYFPNLDRQRDNLVIKAWTVCGSQNIRNCLDGWSICFVVFFKGMEEIGVYRISGVTSEIQRIKKAFDKSKTFILYKVYIYQTKHCSLGISSSLVGLLPVFTFKLSIMSCIVLVKK